MKYVIYIFLVLGVGLFIYGYIYPAKYCLDINIHDTYYVFTYTPVATFVLLLSLLFYVAHFSYKLVKHLLNKKYNSQ